MKNGTGKHELRKEAGKMKKRTNLIAMTIAVLLIFAVNCYGGGNEIYGCYQKHGGELRIVQHPKSCRHSETPISWNMLGPQGPMGPAGPQGPQGPQGPPGQGGEYPKVYDANNQFLGIFPSTYDRTYDSNYYGFLSFFVPTLSGFISLSLDNLDVDPSYPSPSYPSPPFYYDGSNCTGHSYFDASMRFQIKKLDQKYIMADDVKASCKYIGSVLSLTWVRDTRQWSKQCEAVNSDICDLLPSNEVSLPFSLPAAPPVHFK
jgi:hypothetical protein